MLPSNTKLSFYDNNDIFVLWREGTELRKAGKIVSMLRLTEHFDIFFAFCLTIWNILAGFASF